MTEENYVLGRGMVHINDRYIGNSTSLEVVATANGLEVHVETDNISEENMALFRAVPHSPSVTIRYDPMSVLGTPTDLGATGKLVRACFAMKSKTGQWQALRFVIETQSVSMLPVEAKD